MARWRTCDLFEDQSAWRNSDQFSTTWHLRLLYSVVRTPEMVSRVKLHGLITGAEVLCVQDQVQDVLSLTDLATSVELTLDQEHDSQHILPHGLFIACSEWERRGTSLCLG